MKRSVERGWMVRVALGVIGVTVAMLSWGGRALADGMFAAQAGLIQQDIRGPEQKAVILHREGKETLVLSVKYEGAAGDFAWVVPVPSRPKVEKGEAKLFEELARLTAPTVKWPLWPRPKGPAMGGMGGQVEVLERSHVGVYDVAVLAATDETALADWLKKNGYALPGNPEPVLRHYVEKGWFYVAMRIDPKRVEGDLVEALKKIDPRITTLGGAEVVALELAAKDLAAERTYEGSRLKPIVDALAGGTEEGTMGYPGAPPPRPSYWQVGDTYQRAVNQYRVKKEEGTVDGSNSLEAILWVDLRNSIVSTFYEARTGLEASLGQGTLHPISLSFESQEPVYPLRMTSLNPNETKILLYVIAEKRAEARGFRVRFAGPLRVTKADSALGKLIETSWPSPGGSRGKPFLTKLEGDFAPQEMKDDLTIGYARWNRAYREVVSAKKLMSRTAAPPGTIIPSAVGWPLLSFAVGVLVTLVVMRKRSGKRTE